MEICSLPIVAFCGVATIIFHCVPSRRLRQICLSLINVVFLAGVVTNRRSGIWLLAVVLGTFAALRLVRARTVLTLVGLGVAVIIYLEQLELVVLGNWLDLWAQPVFVIGLSYMLFKFVHMLIDEWQGQLIPFSFWSYLNYQLSFFTMMAGPIQRYNDFHRSWEEMDLRPSGARETLLCWSRVLAGMFKMAAVAPLAQHVIVSATRGMHAGSPAFMRNLLVYGYACPILLYFNFAGYTDVMIGSAGLLGFRLPENFNRPYLARNVLDFWNRWHMSLTHWIRDYVFMTPYKQAATMFPAAARYWSYALLFVALFVAGVWHGASSGYVIFGALNGLGAIVVQGYGDLLKTSLGRSGFRRYQQSRAIQCVAVFLTFHYVCFCHFFFSTNAAMRSAILEIVGRRLRHLPDLHSHLQWGVGSLATLAAALVLVAAVWKADALVGFAERLKLRTAQYPTALYGFVAAQTVIVVLLFCFWWAYETEPPPVIYMRF